MTVLGEHGDSYAAFLLDRIQRVLEREEAHAAERYEGRDHVFTLHETVLVDGTSAVGATCRCGWASEVSGSRTTAERQAEQHDREASA